MAPGVAAHSPLSTLAPAQPSTLAPQPQLTPPGFTPLLARPLQLAFSITIMVIITDKLVSQGAPPRLPEADCGLLLVRRWRPACVAFPSLQGSQSFGG